MTLLFQILCTIYFAVLTWTLYTVVSTSGRPPRPWLFASGAATVLMLVLHTAFGATLGVTQGAIPHDKFYLLLKFSGALVVIQVVNPWLRRTFATKAAQQSLPVNGTEKLLAVNAFLANKALYGMIYLYQVLAIWFPGIL